ncbi:MAG: hypothetical protein HW421_2681 [Ignavibacteria bacterium]|nr:hypothetical protein [Ignavibacteria bacterium]
MKKIIQVQIYKGEKYYIAECVGIPVITQAKSLDELIFNIREALELHFEESLLEDYEIVKNPTILANIELGALEYA